LADGVLLADCHQDELTQNAVGAIRQLHGTARVRVGCSQLSACDLRMLKDSAKVLDTDDDVHLVLNTDVVKFVHLNRNVCVERLFENGWPNVN